MEEKKEFDIDKVLRDGNIIYIDLSACDVNDLKRFTQKNTPYMGLSSELCKKVQPT